MVSGVRVPRINNNDDEVKLVGLDIEVGSQVQKGQTIAQVETDKAVVDVEADCDGYVLAIRGKIDETMQVGTVLAWVGSSPNDSAPEDAPPGAQALLSAAGSSAPTAKAAALLAQHGLKAADVPAQGERLTVADVERYLASASAQASSFVVPAPTPAAERPEIDGNLQALKGEERGMLATVLWHRDVAVPGYVETVYETAEWDAYAKQFGSRNNLLLNPLLPLMTWRLVEIARDTPRINATIVGHSRLEFRPVNIGFTVQAGDTLYLAVARDAAAMGELQFVQCLIELQRRASAHKLGPLETRGATIGFSSMSRWKVSRHVPILPPHTALMVAHAAERDGAAVLGASYDHRVLNGGDVASVLRKLTRPGKAS
jgi:pyruvate/2-oxoglutarate dehydrogenase complex dihydrolipoamide acyltransferase (E2) component